MENAGGSFRFEDEENPSEADLVTVAGIAIGHLRAVDMAAVGGSEIFDPKFSVSLRDDAVMPGDAFMNELDIAILAATDFPGLVRQYERSLDVIGNYS